MVGAYLGLTPKRYQSGDTDYTGRISRCGEGGAQLRFAVGFKLHGKTGHVIVDGEDALVAALKIKMQRPEALITYVRRQNKRGDTRHPVRGLGNEHN
jgi:hypothetical protein